MKSTQVTHSLSHSTRATAAVTHLTAAPHDEHEHCTPLTTVHTAVDDGWWKKVTVSLSSDSYMKRALGVHLKEGVDDLRVYVDVSVRHCLRYPGTPTNHAAVPAGPDTMSAALYHGVIQVAFECACARRAELIQEQQHRRARARSAAAVVRRQSPRLVAGGGARSSEALEGVSEPGVSRPPPLSFAPLTADELLGARQRRVVGDGGEGGMRADTVNWFITRIAALGAWRPNGTAVVEVLTAYGNGIQFWKDDPTAFQYGLFPDASDGTRRTISLVELQTVTAASEPAGPGDAGGADLGDGEVRLEAHVQIDSAPSWNEPRSWERAIEHANSVTDVVRRVKAVGELLGMKLCVWDTNKQNETVRLYCKTCAGAKCRRPRLLISKAKHRDGDGDTACRWKCRFANGDHTHSLNAWSAVQQADLRPSADLADDISRAAVDPENLFGVCASLQMNLHQVMGLYLHKGIDIVARTSESRVANAWSAAVKAGKGSFATDALRAALHLQENNYAFDYTTEDGNQSVRTLVWLLQGCDAVLARMGDNVYLCLDGASVSRNHARH